VLAKFTRVLRPINTDIVGTLERGSADVQRVGEEFQRMLHRPDIGINVICFYEELAMPALGKIIENESAILRGYRSCSLHADYRSMTKFSGEIDTGFEQVCATLSRWISRTTDQVDTDLPVPSAINVEHKLAVAPVFQNYGPVTGKSILQNQ
jgi:hypothetical protein